MLMQAAELAAMARTQHVLPRAQHEIGQPLTANPRARQPEKENEPVVLLAASAAAASRDSLAAPSLVPKEE